MHQDIVIVADYHDQNIEFRRFNEANGRDDCLNRPNSREAWLRMLGECQEQARAQGGRLVLVMESTTGWARIKSLMRGKGELILVNVLQLPRSPKAHRRKTDKIDTDRILREYRNGNMPRSFQPRPSLRRLRRLLRLRVDLVRRQTSLRNSINRYLAHETWESREGLWSLRGQGRLRLWLKRLCRWDQRLLVEKLDELDEVAQRLKAIDACLGRIARRWKPARRIDAIYGLGEFSSVAIAACIGPVERFQNAEGIIGYAGLAPGIRESDSSRRDGHIGGGGTDKLLRHCVIEATLWARKIPRFEAAYKRMEKRRGVKVARLHLARMLLRSIDAMLRYDRPFDPSAPPRKNKNRPLPSPSGGSPPEGGPAQSKARRRTAAPADGQ